MTYETEVLADTPDVYYALDDAVASTTVADGSGNGADGAVLTTLYGGAPSTVTLGLPSLVGDSGTAAQFGNGFSGSHGGVLTPGHATVGAFYVEFVVTPLIPNWQVHILQQFSGGSEIFELRIGTGWGFGGDGGQITFWNTIGDPTTVAPPFSVDHRLHVAAGLDSSGHSHFYIDGIEVHTHDYSATTLRSSTVASTGIQFSGSGCIADGFAYYDHDVSQARFQAHLAAIPNTMTASLSLARWTSTSDIEVTPILPESSSADININAGAGYFVTPPTLTARILDPAQRRAPTSLAVVASGAYPRGSLRFYYDANVSYTYAIPADGSGNLAATSIPVPADLVAGAHTLTVESQSPDTPTNLLSVVLGFTLQNNPATGHVVGADADPVDIEEATLPDGERRWILQDLMPGGLGSYVFTHNPATTGRPDFERSLKARRSTANDGRVHVTEGVGIKYPWTIGGFCFTQAEQQELEAWGDLNRRFYVIDDFGEAWTVAATGVQIKPRLRGNLRIGNDPYALTDWLADFTLAVLVYDRDPITPVGAP